PQPLAEQRLPRHDTADHPWRAREAQRGYDPFRWTLELRALRHPRLLRRDQRLCNLLEVAVAILEIFFKLGDQGGRRLVGHEMPRELLGDVPRCRRMAREIGKRGAALIDASVGIALAKHDLLARLMKTLEENKFSAVAGRAYVEEVQPVSTFARLVTSACE